MDSDNKYLAYIFIALYIAMALNFITEDYFESKVKEKAIAAGLHQDDKGNWIK